MKSTGDTAPNRMHYCIKLQGVLSQKEGLSITETVSNQADTTHHSLRNLERNMIEKAIGFLRKNRISPQLMRSVAQEKSHEIGLVHLIAETNFFTYFPEESDLCSWIQIPRNKLQLSDELKKLLECIEILELEAIENYTTENIKNTIRYMNDLIFCLEYEQLQKNRVNLDVCMAIYNGKVLFITDNAELKSVMKHFQNEHLPKDLNAVKIYGPHGKFVVSLQTILAIHTPE